MAASVFVFFAEAEFDAVDGLGFQKKGFDQGREAVLRAAEGDTFFEEGEVFGVFPVGGGASHDAPEFGRDRFIENLGGRGGLIFGEGLEITPAFALFEELVGIEEDHLHRALIDRGNRGIVADGAIGGGVGEGAADFAKAFLAEDFGAVAPEAGGRIGELGDFARVELFVVHPVAVFGSKELEAVGFALIALFESAFNPGDQLLAFFGGRLLFVLRRHVFGGQLIEDLDPAIGGFRVCEVGREIVEGDLAF